MVSAFTQGEFERPPRTGIWLPPTKAIRCSARGTEAEIAGRSRRFLHYPLGLRALLLQLLDLLDHEISILGRDPHIGPISDRQTLHNEIDRGGSGQVRTICVSACRRER